MHLGEDILFLSDREQEALGIAPGDIADAIEEAIADRTAGKLHNAPKAAILPGEGRYMMATMSVGDGPGLTVLKTAMVAPDNPLRNMPSVNATILVMDSQTGAARAVLGANWITAVRTAGLSAVAARRLADPASKVVAFVGCGVQARSHLDAFAGLFPLAEVRAFGRGRANAETLCAKARQMGMTAEICETAEAALRGADLVVTSITLDYSVEPFLDARWLKPGAFAAITDLGIPWTDEGMGAFGAVVVDDMEQEKQSPKPVAPRDLIRADLTELVNGTVPLRHAPDYPTAFAFRGIALGDFAAAALVLERAEAAGAGRRIAV